ncbi:MAG: methionyl-tRNA formyltransferase, partial [Natronospirillum sp.]|uniref:methionyl-tRNA formyltransferase n=1 Tax=Natronospirillum sp. TaxID=2812955 RepID=UPI0025DE1475
MEQALRIVFAGTPEFAALPLARMLAQGIRPIAVYSQPDRPAGRGRQPMASPVKKVAEEAGIPVLQPPSLKQPDAVAELAELKPDLLIVIAYGLLLPADILAIPRLGCVNVHASLLPRWRGAAPIQRAIQAGDTESGVALMLMDEGLDTGPVMLSEGTAIKADTTGGQLHDTLADLGSQALLTF